MKEKKLKVSKFNRALHLGKSLTKLGAGVAKDKILGNSKTISQLKAAKEIVETMGELKGGLMKMGQMLSLTGESVLPKEVTDLFASLQTSSSFMPYEQVCECFEREFNKKPEEIFKEFDRKPFAAASIGQVHSAILKSGEKVAVKVQYPDIETAILNDLNSIDKLEVLFDLFRVPRPQMDSALAELKRSLLAECDYDNELKAMNEIRSDLEGKFPFVHIPKAFEDYSTKRILCTEFVKGDSFEESLKYSQADRDKLGESLYESFLYSLFECKHLHTDPQNGNYLFTPEKIFLFDFGSTRNFSNKFVQDYALLQYSVEIKNLDLYREVGLSLSLLQENDSREFIRDHMSLVDNIYGPYLNEGTYFARGANPFGLVKEFLSNMDFKGRPTPMDEFLLLDRANVGLFMKLQSWESRVNWRKGMQKYRTTALEEAKKRYGM